MDMAKTLKVLLISLVIYLWISVAACFAQSPEQIIRVKIFDDLAVFNVVIRGDYAAKQFDSDKILKSGKNLKSKISAYRGGTLLAGNYLAAKKIIIKPNSADVPIEVNGRRFKGSLVLIRRDNGLLSVINYLGLEDYVKGISVREISHYWPMDALKAQTVAFRTFALYRAEQFKNKEWDVSDDKYSQVYGGQEAERYRINEAVDKTKGEVLYYNGKILPAFYHSTCAGTTEDASELWDIDLAPLKGVVCGFCKESPHFSWKAVVPKDKIKQALEKQGQKIKNVMDVVVSGHDGSGRASNLNIVTAEKDIEIAAKDFRNLIGPDIIKSLNFKISVNNDGLAFDGQGWGHGVGLCQWGAYFMAKSGVDYLNILKYYYPGSTIAQLSS